MLPLLHFQVHSLAHAFLHHRERATKFCSAVEVGCSCSESSAGSQLVASAAVDIWPLVFRPKDFFCWKGEKVLKTCLSVLSMRYSSCQGPHIRDFAGMKSPTWRLAAGSVLRSLPLHPCSQLSDVSVPSMRQSE